MHLLEYSVNCIWLTCLLLYMLLYWGGDLDQKDHRLPDGLSRGSYFFSTFSINTLTMSGSN